MFVFKRMILFKSGEGGPGPKAIIEKNEKKIKSKFKKCAKDEGRREVCSFQMCRLLSAMGSYKVCGR